MASKKLSVSEGDWVCSDESCGNVNFSWRSHCNKCGQVKGKVDVFKKAGREIGKGFAEKSGGLFSADDWQCPSCGNVNWARRNECNICNTPKLDKVEARTGVGGGYNEREGVEYIEREESDDEFDEFGRKKKKLRSKVPGNQLEQTAAEEDTSQTSQLLKDEEDEDSEDSDDEDVSKYDLFADLDDAPLPIQAKPLSRRQVVLGNNNNTAPHASKGDNEPQTGGRSRDSRRSRSRSRDRRRSRSRSRDRKDRRRSRSRSRSRDRRDRRRSRSRSRSRDRRDRRRSRSRSRSRDRRDRRRSRSRSRDRRRSRSRSRSRDRERGRSRNKGH